MLDWPASLGADGGYGKLVRVELLHKLRDEARYDGLPALTAAIEKDVVDARTWLARTRARTPPRTARPAATELALTGTLPARSLRIAPAPMRASTLIALPASGTEPHPSSATMSDSHTKTDYRSPR